MSQDTVARYAIFLTFDVPTDLHDFEDEEGTCNIVADAVEAAFEIDGVCAEIEFVELVAV